MLTIMTNIEDLLERGFTIDQIAELTRYPIDEIKKIENNWRIQIKRK